MSERSIICSTPAETFGFGEDLGASLKRGDVVLLSGELGAGKTLLTKGILNALGFDVDEVTSPSFTLVNLYKTQKLDIYHIDLWRLDSRHDIASAVGLDEIVDKLDAITIIEWADRLENVVGAAACRAAINALCFRRIYLAQKEQSGLPSYLINCIFR